MPNGMLWRNLSSPRRCHRFTLSKKACRSAGPVLFFHTRGPELAEVPKYILRWIHNPLVRLGILQLDVSYRTSTPIQIRQRSLALSCESLLIVAPLLTISTWSTSSFSTWIASFTRCFLAVSCCRQHGSPSQRQCSR